MAFKIDSKKIAKNTLTLYIRQVVTMFISFFTVRKTLEQLGVEDYGLNNLVGSIVAMFSFINGSMGTAVQRFYSYEIGRENKDRLKNVFGVGLYLHSIVAVITLLIAEAFAIFFLDKMNIPPERIFAAQVVFQASAVTLVLGVISVPYSALLRAREMFAQMAFVEIVQAFLRLGVLYLLFVIPFDKLVILSLLNLGVSFVGIIVFVIMARKFEETHSGPLRNRELVREMLKFVSMLLFTVLASLANTQGIVMLINLFFGLTVNAAYAVAVQVQHAVNTFVVNFKSSMVPQIMAAFGAGDLESMHRLIDFGTKLTFLMLLVVTHPITISAHWFLEIWLEKPPQNAAELVVLILIYINISSFTYFHYQGIHASGKIAQQQVFISGSYLIAIVIIFVLFKMGMSFYMAVIVNMVLGVFHSCVNLYYAKKRYDYPLIYFCKNIFCPVVVIIIFSIGMIICINGIESSNLIKLLYSIAVDLLIIMIGFFLLFNPHERKKIMDFIKNQ